MVLGQLPSGKIVPPNPKTKLNPNPNPNPNRGAIFFGGNFPDTFTDISLSHMSKTKVCAQKMSWKSLLICCSKKHFIKKSL